MKTMSMANVSPYKWCKKWYRVNIYVGPKNPGYYQISWDGKDINGKACGSGVYYIIMKAGKQTFQRKAVLMK